MYNIYAARRARFLEALPANSAAVVSGHREVRRNGDSHYPFRQRSDLLYLTGFPEPETLAIFTPGKAQKFTLLCRPRDAERELWNGRRAGLEGAKERYGADQAFPIDESAKRLKELLDGCDEVYLHPGEDSALDKLVLETIAALRREERRGKRAPRRLVDLMLVLHEQRLLKDEEALRCMRRAAAITSEAHQVAMRATQPGLYEYEIQALLEYVFQRHGGCPGYGSIVGAGRNGTILHYVDNQDPLPSGELLLVDAGGEWQGYTADVTRTYPIPRERGARARFSPEQLRIYSVVLKAQQAGIERAVPGSSIEQIHQRCLQVLTEGMVEIGLLQGDCGELMESKAYERYYMHRTSHWLGLDVHDVGAYRPERVLEPGMVLTIEPGLYVREDDPSPYKGMAVRIEDDVLITTGQPEVLTASIPKLPQELEALVGQGGSISF